MRIHVRCWQSLKAVDVSVSVAVNTMNVSDRPDGQVCSPDLAHLLLTNDNISSYTYGPQDTAVLCIVMPIIGVIGVIGNSLFLFVLVRVPWMRTVSTNVYLAFLAVADIIFVITAVGSKLARYASSPFKGDDTILGVPGCVSIYFLNDFSFFVSLFLITLISFERYTAVCRPFAFRRRTGGSTIGPAGRKTIFPVVQLALCLIIGVATACSLMPDRLVWVETCVTWLTSYIGEEELEKYPEIVGRCSSIIVWYFKFSNCIQTIPFFATLPINFTLYVLIARKLFQQTKRRRQYNGNNTNQGQQVRARDQITLMLLINGTAYFVFLLPFEAAALVFTINDFGGSIPSGLISDELTLNIFRCLLYVNSAINPFIYTITSPAYRRAFMEAFYMCKNTQPTSEATNQVDLLNMPKVTKEITTVSAALSQTPKMSSLRSDDCDTSSINVNEQ